MKAFVWEATRKIVSVFMGRPASTSALPKAWSSTTRPLRATYVTTPATFPASTYCCIPACRRARRSDERPTDSGVAAGGASARSAGATSKRAESAAKRWRRVMGPSRDGAGRPAVRSYTAAITGGSMSRKLFAAGCWVLIATGLVAPGGALRPDDGPGRHRGREAAAVAHAGQPAGHGARLRALDVRHRGRLQPDLRDPPGRDGTAGPSPASARGAGARASPPGVDRLRRRLRDHDGGGLPLLVPGATLLPGRRVPLFRGGGGHGAGDRA